MTNATPGSNRTAVAPALPDGVTTLLMALSFLATLFVATRLYDLRSWYNWDVWFQSDSNVYLDVATGTAVPPWVLARHPAAAPLGQLVVLGIARLLTLLRIATGSAVAAQSWVFLVSIPLLNALRTRLVLQTALRLTGTAAGAVLVALLDMAAFAVVTVGSVPESYPVTACAISLMYWLALDDRPRAPWVHPALWIVAGVVAIGATVTNAFAWVVLLGLSRIRRGDSLRRAGIQFVGLGGVVAGMVLVLAVVGAGSLQRFRSGMHDTGSMLRPVSAVVATELGWMVGHTFLAPRPAPETTWVTPSQNPEYDFTWSFSPPYRHGWPSLWRLLATALLVGAGIAGFARRPGYRGFGIAAGSIILFNAGLNLFFGDHFALYALHWHTSLLVLAAGGALLGTDRRPWLVAMACFVAVTAFNSADLLLSLFRYMAQA